jgi:hypothetical protein
MVELYDGAAVVGDGLAESDRAGLGVNADDAVSDGITATHTGPVLPC